MKKATTAIPRSKSLQSACESFVEEIGRWAHDCIEQYESEPATDVHDQLTYTTGWEPYVRASGDEKVLGFLRAKRDRVAEHFTASDQWHHGYWAMQEAHHGTEHFELFLGMMARLAPEDEQTRKQIVDAAEHLGNWNSAVPDWFDFETGLFRSLFFGTDGVRVDEGELNMPDHLRCTNILMLADYVDTDPRYLDLATNYARRWAEAIRDNPDRLPIGIGREGPVYELAGDSEKTYRSFAGMAGLLNTTIDRAENILASGGIQLFLALGESSGERVFAQAARRLNEVLVGELRDPDAGPAADAIRRYRRTTGDGRFDEAVRAAVGTAEPRTLSFEIPTPNATRPPGVGKRADMPLWYEDDEPRRRNPITMAVAAEIDDDRELARAAVDLARAYVAVARKLMPDGRDHGCAATTVSAVARGHGRDNHAGVTTAVLQPILEWVATRGDSAR